MEILAENFTKFDKRGLNSPLRGKILLVHGSKPLTKKPVCVKSRQGSSSQHLREVIWRFPCDSLSKSDVFLFSPIMFQNSQGEEWDGYHVQSRHLQSWQFPQYSKHNSTCNVFRWEILRIENSCLILGRESEKGGLLWNIIKGGSVFTKGHKVVEILPQNPFCEKWAFTRIFVLRHGGRKNLFKIMN